MKYPAQQFDLLVNALRQLSAHIDVTSINPSALHFIIYQQGSKGQTHNWLYFKGEGVTRAHKLESLEGWQKVADVPETFQLYPDGCNDPHIETAVKKAIKSI